MSTVYTDTQLSSMMDALTARVNVLDGQNLLPNQIGKIQSLTSAQNGFSTQLKNVVSELQAQLITINNNIKNIVATTGIPTPAQLEASITTLNSQVNGLTTQLKEVVSNIQAQIIKLFNMKTGPAGINWQGPWNGTISYIQRDCVSYSNSLYICIMPNLNVEPGTDDTKWSILVTTPSMGTILSTILSLGG